jgi:alpha/beta superfamily hydrolase
VSEPRSLVAEDGIELEAELALPDATSGPPRAAAVLCHPHPQHGGSMRSIVVSALFDALPRAGVVCLRFNFRGVERSGGRYDEGRGERHDVLAAVRALDAEIDEHVPLVLMGWSFGADLALVTADDRLAGWVAIAPPLRFTADFAAVASDARPKLLVLAQHDEFRDPASVVEETEAWNETTVEVVPGASHFFVGRTDRVIAAARGFVDGVTR